MALLQSRHILKTGPFVTSPKQDVAATFIPLSQGSCSAGAGQWHTRWLAQSWQISFPEGCGGNLVILRKWMVLNHGAEGRRKKTKQKTKTNHDSHYPKEKVKEQGFGDYRLKPHKHTSVSANTTLRMSGWLPLLWRVKEQQKSDFPKQRNAMMTK